VARTSKEGMEVSLTLCQGKCDVADQRPLAARHRGGRGSMSTSTRTHPEILAFVPRRQNSLQGFAEVRLPSGMILHDVSVHIDGARAWAMPASKAMLDKNGLALRDDRGKVRYSPVITIASKELRDRFSEAIIEAIRLSHPDVLTPSEIQR
jgi:hypothetical protein